MPVMPQAVAYPISSTDVAMVPSNEPVVEVDAVSLYIVSVEPVQVDAMLIALLAVYVAARVSSVVPSYVRMFDPATYRYRPVEPPDKTPSEAGAELLHSGTN